MSKHHGMTVRLEAWVQLPNDELRDMFLDDDGTHVPPKEARRNLARAFGRGFDVLPVCDNPNSVGYCGCDPDAMPCPKCGREDFPSGANFCGKCGYPVVRVKGGMQ